jgi:RecA/RadA recombinase
MVVSVAVLTEKTTNPNNHFGIQRTVATIKRFPWSHQTFISAYQYRIGLVMSHVLPTGCKAIDNLLGGGIHCGMITDIYGESGAGKSQLCFTICARSAKYFRNIPHVSVIFVDTGGTFRPERIREIAIEDEKSESDLLDKILLMRSFSSTDQINSVKRIANINPRIIVIDGVASLFTTGYQGAARHLALMKYLHELALAAINLRCAIVMTNMIRAGTNQVKGLKITSDPNTKNQLSTEKELMGRSVSIYAHMKLILRTVRMDKSLFKASLVQPLSQHEAYYTITKRGVTDFR